MSRSKKKTVLLSSVCKPFGPEYGDGFGVSAEGTHQIMWAQGVFRVRATTTQWGIDFIAANLQAPTVTLHYPTLRRFIREIRKGYDYIGIAFIDATIHKMIPMVNAIRKYAPDSEVILGGYGTILEPERLALYGDHICRGEGVTFMRRLLGEEEDAPIVQPVITQQQKLFSVPLPSRTGYIFGGLGCPNGCDFCATSHYFKQKHIKFLKTGQDILRAVRDLRRHHPDITDFWINDEDFLLNERRGRQFLEALRASDLPPLSLSAFSSVKALSQYHPEELVEMGIDWLWIGYEGRRAGYAKMKGKSYEKLFGELRSHGISVLASMIIGFDYQTPEIIREEFEELLRLNPTMAQFLIYGPVAGTPLFDRLKSEDRLDPVIQADNRLHDGFTLGFRHPTIDREEMSAIQKELYRAEFKRLGPSVFRVVACMLEGYDNLKNHPTPRIRAKAETYARTAHQALMLIPAALPYAPAETRAGLRELIRRIEDRTGPLTVSEQAREKLLPAMIRYTNFKLKNGIRQQPESTRRVYRMPKNPFRRARQALHPRPIPSPRES